MIIALIIVAIIILGISSFIWIFIERIKSDSFIIEKVLGVLTFLSLIVFIFVLRNHSTPYFKDIDPFVEPCYSPISYRYSGGVILIHILSLVSMGLLYFKEFKLPPLQIVVYIVMLILGIVINTQFLYQISEHDTSNIHLWNNGDYAGLLLSFYPIVLIIVSIGILQNMIRNKAKLNKDLVYKNKWLNLINYNLVRTQNLPLYLIMITIPILIIILLILLLLGQDIESLTKVYSETATWKFSDHIHPPTVDDRHGHYLCTVAAYGSPDIVKPIGLGRRNNKIIIINRQLQIANAFENIIERISPISHQVIRTNYDKYGINLAKRINNKGLSNFTYILMKPLELVFLISLYLYFVDPEKIINDQYK